MQQTSYSNELLASLSKKALARIESHLELAPLTFGQVLYEPEDTISYVYFPCDSLASLLTVVDQHLAIEVGMVGSEGLVGVSVPLGINISQFRAVVQGAGVAYRMRSALYLKEFALGEDMYHATHHYIHSLMIQIAQTAACNRFHHINARLARWLMMTRDRLHRDEFYLTHDFLGRMLGVRREGVTEAAHGLKAQHLINYVRGNISILDVAGLQKVSCSCYKPLKLSSAT